MGGDLVVDFDDKIWLLTLVLMLLQALRHSIIMHLTHNNGNTSKKGFFDDIEIHMFECYIFKCAKQHIEPHKR